MTTEVMDGLVEVYQGEWRGELVLEALLASCRDPQQRRILATLAQFEAETRIRLRPTMVQLGLPTTMGDDVPAAFALSFARLKDLPWLAFVETVRDGIRDVFIPRYRQIADLAVEDGDPLAIAATHYMVIHEVALLDALDRLLRGEANPTRAINALLHFPMGGAPG